MTITLDSRPEIPLHPLDLTGEPPVGAAASTFCVGLIQAADAYLTRADSDTGDMILGVPFLRNVYTVMAYDAPDARGAFNPNRSVSASINPRLGLLQLTDPTVALTEFKRVRVYHEPLSPGAAPSSPGGSGAAEGRRRNVGINVLIGLAAFVGLCFLLFAGRWAVGRWATRRSSGAGVAGGEKKKSKKWAGGLGGAYRMSRKRSAGMLPSEDTLRRARYDSYARKERLGSAYTASDSTRTRVNSDVDPDVDVDGEMGLYKMKNSGDPLALADSTLVAPAGAADDPWEETLKELYGQSHPAPPRHTSSESVRHGHERGPSTVEGDAEHDDEDDEDGFDRAAASTTTPATSRTARAPVPPPPHHQHQPTQSVSWPLLVHARNSSQGSEEEDLAEFGLSVSAAAAAAAAGPRGSMAGIGTAARGSRIDPGVRNASVSSLVGGGVFPEFPPPAVIIAREVSPSPPLVERGRYPSLPRASSHREFDFGGEHTLS